MLVNRCDCCCLCGLFCSNDGYCGRYMEWILTLSGASVGSGGVCLCTDLNSTVNVPNDFAFASESAATWNATRPAWTGRDAKDGTTVCSWNSGDSIAGDCNTSLSGFNVATYYGTDNKWYMVVSMLYAENSGYIATLAGEVEFSGSGAPMDCGTPGEGSPTFSLTVPLAPYDEIGTSGVDCNPPNSVLVEGNPQNP